MRGGRAWFARSRSLYIVFPSFHFRAVDLAKGIVCKYYSELKKIFRLSYTYASFEPEQILSIGHLHMNPTA